MIYLSSCHKEEGQPGAESNSTSTEDTPAPDITGHWDVRENGYEDILRIGQILENEEYNDATTVQLYLNVRWFGVFRDSQVGTEKPTHYCLVQKKNYLFLWQLIQIHEYCLFIWVGIQKQHRHWKHKGCEAGGWDCNGGRTVTLEAERTPWGSAVGKSVGMGTPLFNYIQSP